MQGKSSLMKPPFSFGFWSLSHRTVCFVSVAYDQCIIVDWDVEAGAITLLSVLSQRVVRVTIGVTSGHITHEQPW